MTINSSDYWLILAAIFFAVIVAMFRLVNGQDELDAELNLMSRIGCYVMGMVTGVCIAVGIGTLLLVVFLILP